MLLPCGLIIDLGEDFRVFRHLRNAAQCLDAITGLLNVARELYDKTGLRLIQITAKARDLIITLGCLAVLDHCLGTVALGSSITEGLHCKFTLCSFPFVLIESDV